jgi:hypothetical protein
MIIDLPRRTWDITGDNIEGMMASAADLTVAVEQRCSCPAELVETVPVHARLDDGRTWDVDVQVFALTGYKTGTAYAWTGSMEGPSEVFVALDIGPIRSALSAVCATAADHIRARRLAGRRV